MTNKKLLAVLLSKLMIISVFLFSCSKSNDITGTDPVTGDPVFTMSGTYAGFTLNVSKTQGVLSVVGDTLNQNASFLLLSDKMYNEDWNFWISTVSYLFVIDFGGPLVVGQYTNIAGNDFYGDTVSSLWLNFKGTTAVFYIDEVNYAEKHLKAHFSLEVNRYFPNWSWQMGEPSNQIPCTGQVTGTFDINYVWFEGSG